MRRPWIWLLAALVAAAPGAPARAGKKNPPIKETGTLVCLDGRELSFADPRGRAALLDFWATWCAPCRDALPVLKRLHQRMLGEPLEIISISVDRDREALEHFIDVEQMDWRQVWDDDGSIAKAFGVKRFPTYILIDFEGRPVGSVVGKSPRGDSLLTVQVGREVKRARKALRQEP